MCTINKTVILAASLMFLGSLSQALDVKRSCSSVDGLKHSSVVCNDETHAIYVQDSTHITGVQLKLIDAKHGREVQQDVSGLNITFADAKNQNWKNAKAVTKVIATFEKNWKTKPVVEVPGLEFDKDSKLYQDPQMQAEAKWQTTKVNRNIASARDKMLSISGVGRAQKK